MHSQPRKSQILTVAIIRARTRAYSARIQTCVNILQISSQLQHKSEMYGAYNNLYVQKKKKKKKHQLVKSTDSLNLWHKKKQNKSQFESVLHKIRMWHLTTSKSSSAGDSSVIT